MIPRRKIKQTLREKHAVSIVRVLTTMVRAVSRPDVRLAKREVEATGSCIGVAVADLYPS